MNSDYANTKLGYTIIDVICSPAKIKHYAIFDHFKQLWIQLYLAGKNDKIGMEIPNN